MMTLFYKSYTLLDWMGKDYLDLQLFKNAENKKN